MNNFVKRFGDRGEDELEREDGTISQRLLMMNGNAVRQATKVELFGAAGRLANLAPNDEACVRAAYLVTLTRQPTQPELDHFVSTLETDHKKHREQAVEDMLWALINASEFSWNQ